MYLIGKPVWEVSVKKYKLCNLYFSNKHFMKKMCECSQWCVIVVSCRYANSSLIKYMEKHKVKPDSKVFLLVGASLLDGDVGSVAQATSSHSPWSCPSYSSSLERKKIGGCWGKIKYFSCEVSPFTSRLNFFQWFISRKKNYILKGL